MKPSRGPGAYSTGAIQQCGYVTLLLAGAMATLPKGLDSFGSLCLRQLGFALPELLFVVAQLSECLILAALPFVSTRLRVEWFILGGPLGWLSLYTLMALATVHRSALIMGIGLAAFQWLNCAFQVSLQRALSERLQTASVQNIGQAALLAAVGMGQFVGALIWGLLAASTAEGTATNWTVIWGGGVALSVLVLPLALWVNRQGHTLTRSGERRIPPEPPRTTRP
jgi:hypothetical protein